MFFRGKKKTEHYDKETEIPVLRCSICTGEQVAGFKDKSTGKFRDIMLIQSDRDLEEFKKIYGVEKLIKEY